MSVLSKLTVKSVTRASKQDPVQLRRRKLVAAIEEQVNVAAAAVNGETYEVTRKTWIKNEQGEKVLVDKLRKVRPWFFEQDGGWYVQCKYGNKALTIGNGNAVFVKALKDIASALNTLKAATEAGELDDAIAKATQRKKSK
jgi:hypothetical protein